MKRLVPITEEFDDFLYANRHLFTLIGVFGALTVYVRKADFPAVDANSVPHQSFAIAACFGIVLLLSSVLSIKLIDKIHTPGERAITPENIPFLSFLLLLIFLLRPIWKYTSQFTGVWKVAILAVGVGFPVIVFTITVSGFRRMNVPAQLAERFGTTKNRVTISMFFGSFVLLFLFYAWISFGYRPALIDRIADNPTVGSSHIWHFLLLYSISIWIYISAIGTLWVSAKSGYYWTKSKVLGRHN